MATRNSLLRAAALQEVGGAPDEQQSDRIRAAQVRLASGDRVLLAVVADGSGPGGAEAAAMVVEQVFQTVQASRPRNLAGALRRGLQIADERLRKSGGGSLGRASVSATAAAVWRDRLHVVHVGHTLALRVTGGRGVSLTQVSSARLGGESAAELNLGSWKLSRGDRVVLTSDGMLRRNPETGKPFVEQEEIAEHVSELPANEAVRHLVSLALGRDVDDNVSVAVLAKRGRAQTERRFAWATAGVGLLLVGAAAIAAAYLLGEPAAPASTDYGFAVLVEGGALADFGSGTPELVPSLGTIPGATFLTASTDAKLGLQSTFAGGSDVSQANLYLEQTTGIELTAIDPRDTGDNPAPQGSDLTLVAGRLLIVRESGTWEFRVHVGGFTANLIGAGRAAMGIAVETERVSVHCLLGTCRANDRSTEPTLLQPMESLIGVGSSFGEQTPVPGVDMAAWDSLCGGCLATDG